MRDAVLVRDVLAIERTKDERRSEERGLNRHRHTVAGQRIDDARRVADHENAMLDWRPRAKDHRLRRQESVLRGLMPRVERLELFLFATDRSNE